MAKLKGDRLVVCLGASQVRSRLKGFGHGVRKVQADGRHRAVIIHTATGRHLQELKAKFADVGIEEQDLSLPIEEVRNLGPTSGAWLRAVGIETASDLQRLGPVLAFRLVKQRQPKTSLNLLWAMAAGVEGRDWRELSESERSRLLDQVAID